MKEKEALWWKKTDGNGVECGLCPRRCRINEGKFGFCGVRKNVGGTLFSLAYGRPVALQVDPIEKKPLAEFLPGSKTFSLGTYGCNLNCVFCQNHHLSRGCYGDSPPDKIVEPKEIVELARRHKCLSVACTYNEPTVFAEYAVDIFKLAKKEGLSTVLVSNGYITSEAAKELYPLVDAANIDMKGFSEDFYKEMTGASLEPVLEAMKYFHSIGGHLEITNLMIPGKNDSAEMLEDFFDWLERNVSKDTPLHFSAYHPDYKYQESPSTPASILFRTKERAESRGFGHVYLGNIGFF